MSIRKCIVKGKANKNIIKIHPIVKGDRNTRCNLKANGNTTVPSALS